MEKEFGSEAHNSDIGINILSLTTVPIPPPS
jgi:hypothetical protein